MRITHQKGNAMYRLLSLYLLIVLTVAALPAATTAQGNSEAAHACQESGYLNYTDAEGNPFRNAGQCTSYAARGGELVPVSVGTATLSFYPHEGTDYCIAQLTVTGYTPGRYQATFTSHSYGWELEVEADGSGRVDTAAFGNYWVWPKNFGEVIAYLDGTAVASATVAC